MNVSKHHIVMTSGREKVITAIFRTCVSLPLMAPSHAAAQSPEHFAPFIADSYTCYDKNETCERKECFPAPEGYVFWNKSLKVEEKEGRGFGPRWCKISYRATKMFASPDRPNKLLHASAETCVTAHAETGTPPQNEEPEAWIHCQLTGVWAPIGFVDDRVR